MWKETESKKKKKNRKGIKRMTSRKAREKAELIIIRNKAYKTKRWKERNKRERKKKKR